MAQRAAIKKALGIDGIPYKVLKKAILTTNGTSFNPNLRLLGWLYAIFNASAKLGYYLIHFRDSLIVALLKPKKLAYKVGFYRPIALLSTIGKTIEGVITEQI